MRVTIKLILNAAALLLLHAASGGYAASVPVTTGYYIRKDVKKADGTTEKNVCCSIALSVDKVQYTLTVPENSYSGYTAAYEDGNGNWQVLKETDGQTEWKSVTDTSKKEKLAKLFAPVQNQNMEISAADGTAAELTSPGYIVQSESPALAAEVSGQAYKGIVLPSLSGGRFYLAEYGTGTTYLLTFRTAGSFMDLEAEALSKGRTRQQILNNMFSWLAAADKDKESSTDSVLSEKLAEMLAESLVKDDAFDGLYTTGGNEYIRGYVEKAFTNGRNIYADRLHNSDAQYNPKGYKAIDADESGKLADKAVEINSLKRGSRKKYETSAGGRALIADCIAQSGLSGVTGSPAFGRMLTDDDAFEELTEYIPELNEVRRGDIVTELVTNKNETKENIGIITKADGTGSTDGIDVVWLRNGRLYVETSTLSEFGKNPNTIRCRRLLKKTDSAGTYEQAENWDVLDRVPVSAELETGSMSEENQASSERWRWIPNTGEYLVLGDIKVTMKNRGGMNLRSLENSEYEVTLAGAYDREYSSVNTGQGNIYNNKGTGFTAAVLDPGDSKTVLSRGTLGNGHETTVMENGKTTVRYRYSYTGGQPFSVKKNGVLITATGGNVRLGIRPDKADDAYAGDDLLLIFKVKSKNSSGEILSENDFKVKDSDYLAVYDKKLLWRANLYIDKPEKDIGDIDWNTAHPWTGEEGYGENEWNKTYDFSTLESEFNISKLAEGDGTQNIIIPNSSIYSYNGSNGTIVNKTVVYDLNGQDGPFLFNYKTDCQRKILGRFYNAQGDFNGTIQNGTIYTPPMTVASPYMQTTAPGSVHHNYMHSGAKYTLDVLKVKDEPNPTLNSNARAISGESMTIFGITYYPYVPALTNSITAQFGSPETVASDITTGYTAGTDCVSFGQRSAGYEDNKYTWPELGDGLWGKSWDQSQGYPYWNGYGIKIASWNDTYTVTDENGSSGKAYTGLDCIVPGDIGYYLTAESTSDGSAAQRGGAHLFIVSDVSSGGTMRKVTNIKLVESTNSSLDGKVQRKNSLGDYDDDSRKWYIVRLKTK